MKVYFFSLISLLSATSFAVVAPPHIEPVGLRFGWQQVQAIEKKFEKKLTDKNINKEDKDLVFLLNVGKRASLWLNTINAHRPKEAQLDFSRPGGAKGIPITEPMKTSTSILIKQYEDFLVKTTPLLTDVLASSVEFPIHPPISDIEFIDGLRTLDRIYQNTIRWAGAQEWMSHYINRAIFDIRGYLFLKEKNDLEETLNSFSIQPAAVQIKLRSWLLGLCRNGDFDPTDCAAELKKDENRNRIFSFYNRFNKYGKSMHELFYTIKKTRPEVFWNEDKTQLISPFLTPEKENVTKWLKENVEDEWKSNRENLVFNLIIDYKQTTQDIPRIQFKEGVTANVNGIGGNLITMEAEYPIESADQKWTIRHEYGHVLGFEDCYLEFFDTYEKAMIYYEIDVDNLMCSRKGSLKPTHIEQLKKAYK